MPRGGRSIGRWERCGRGWERNEVGLDPARLIAGERGSSLSELRGAVRRHVLYPWDSLPCREMGAGGVRGWPAG